MSARYPEIYNALDGLHEKKVLHTKNARTIARRAGLRSRPAGPVSTLVSCYLEAQRPDLSYQFARDLSGVRRIRFLTTVENILYLFASPTVFGSLDPADYEPVEVGGVVVNATHTEDSDFLDLPAAFRRPARLAFSISDTDVAKLGGAPPFDGLIQSGSVLLEGI